MTETLPQSQRDPLEHQPLAACPCCGLVQQVPALDRRSRAHCIRCGTVVRSGSGHVRSNNRAAALALAALILYPLGVGLPMLRIEQLGHRNESSILEGISSLFGHGHLFVGAIVLICSVIFPVLKLIALLVLGTGGLGMADRHRAVTYRLVEWTGRWGMLDVLLVAVLVAAMKLGDYVSVSPGPAATAFAASVGLSLLAAATFNPHRLWETTV